MKKIVLITIAVVFLIGGAMVFLFLPKGHGNLAMEDVLPAQAVFYVRADNLSQRVENFSKTKLFNDLKNLDYKKVSSTVGVAPESAIQFEEKLSAFFSVENQKLIKALFGKEVAIAVYTDDSFKNMKDNSPAVIQKALFAAAGNVFIATRVGSDVGAAESVLKFWGQFSKDFKTNTTQYKGKKITVIESQDGSIKVAYVRLGDVIVIGLGEKAAQSAIDVQAKAQKPLASDADFLKRKKTFLEGADTVGYLSVHPIYQLVQSQINAMGDAPQTKLYADQLANQLKQVQGLEALVFANKSGDLFIGKTDLYFDKMKLDPVMRGLYTCAPDDNKSANFVPWDALFYQWTTCLDFPGMVNQYKEQLSLRGQASARPMDVGKMISGYEQMLGLSIEGDILPALGREFGVYLSDVDITGSFPIPKLVFFVETTGRDKASLIINKLFAIQPNLRPDEEQYSGEVIHYIAIPFVENLKLSYTFSDNYLLLSTNVDVLKASLDAAKNPSKAIGASMAFSSMKGKSNSVVFVQFDRLMDKLIAILDWSSQMAKKMQIQRQAFVSGSEKKIETLNASNEGLKTELKDKKNRLAQMEKIPDVSVELDALRKKIVAEEAEISANEESVKNLTKQIKSYQYSAPKQEADQQAVDQFIKPLLQALTNIKFISTTTVNSDDVMSTTIQMKME
ncbi:MAG: DUF3352 domain-containing protein [Candidatus Omnitrophica bacterium]|nr:DUF3352 domain-containing protein [Candidatus Omnitrophota bacterium]